VDDGPADDGVRQRRRRELVQVVHPGTLHPRAHVGHVDEERRLNDHERLPPRGVLRLAPVLVGLGVDDEQFHPGFQHGGRLGPLPPQRHRDWVAAPPVRLHLYLGEVRGPVAGVYGSGVVDGEHGAAELHGGACGAAR